MFRIRQRPGWAVSAPVAREQVIWICQDTSPHSLRGFKGDHSDWCLSGSSVATTADETY